MSTTGPPRSSGLCPTGPAPARGRLARRSPRRPAGRPRGGATGRQGFPWPRLTVPAPPTPGRRSGATFVLASIRMTKSRPPPCHARDRVERVFEIARQGGKAARPRADGRSLQGAPAHMPRGHRGDQDDVGRAGLAQDLARSRVDAGDPAQSARDRVRWAARYHRAGQEDEQGAQGLRDQVPGRHQAVSCGLRKCRKLRLIFP